MIRQPNNSGSDFQGKRLAFVAMGLTAATSGYLTVQGLRHPHAMLAGGGEQATRVLGGYVAVRTAALSGAAVAAGLARAWDGLRLLLLVNGVVQLGDVGVGVWQRDVVRAAGPAGFAALLFIGAVRLRRSGQQTTVALGPVAAHSSRYRARGNRRRHLVDHEDPNGTSVG